MSIFLQVIRYIHQNPIKAGICEKMKEYNYSSYNEYFADLDSSIVDKDFVLE